MILVTGSRGYIGSALTERLRAAGHTLYAQRFDVLDPQSYPDIKPDAVVHLAGGGGPIETLRDPLGAFRTNVLGTQRVVEWARERNARVVYASSCYVYAPIDVLEVVDETAPPDPDTLYGAAKASAEIPVFMSGGTVLRFAHVFGPSPVCQRSVTGIFVRAAAAGEPVTIHGSGKQSYEYVHIEDACAAILRAVEESHPGVLNIGTGETLSVWGLAEICRSEGAPEIRYTSKPNETISYRRMDSSRARRWGWQPQHRLIPALKEWIHALRS